MKIRHALESDLDAFFEYLDRHLQENGADQNPVFQPMSREESKLNDAVKLKFRSGLETDITSKNWRRLLLAISDEKILGHIDIRPYPDSHTNHRALLGMGVDSSHRGKGVGSLLLTNMFDWASKNTNIEYIDLWVLSDNQPAYALYLKHGFAKCGEVKDMFRIDGKSLAHSMMSRRIVNQ